MAQFVAGLSVADTITIDWRIVSLSEPQPGLLAVPFQRFLGTVTDIDEWNADGAPKTVTVEYFTIDQTTQERIVVGVFELPPQQLDGAFIEVANLAKSAPVLPSFAQILRKRAREEGREQGQEQQQGRNDLRDLVEAITKKYAKV